MKDKLASFETFTSELYPHELDYLLSIQQFQKESNIKILNLIHYNSRNPKNRLPFDKTVDKRTYSYLKTWIIESLQKVDVDIFHEWLSRVEHDIMTDNIQTSEEKRLLGEMGNITPSSYYFMKFYRVLQHYRDYLIVRNRTRNYTFIGEYLDRYKGNYLQSQSLNNKINEAAEKVVFRKILVAEEFSVWETLFSEIYYNETIDGYTRYRAVIRLTILYYTNREFDKLRMVYDHLDRQFKTSVFYCKRILANYYANRAMMHSKLNQLDDAEKYGLLSIRHTNSDYLFYLVSVVDILLRNKKPHEALQIMVESFPELKKSGNFYYKIGFASYYIKTLVENNMLEKAMDYGEVFLNGYKREIFEFRWHLFFTSYITALFRAEKYSKIISLVRRYKLAAKEKQLLGSAQYLPFIQLYMVSSEYLEGVVSCDNLKKCIMQQIFDLGQNRFRHRKVMELLQTLAQHLPDLIHEVMVELRLTEG
ncbi:MAG TPA: hypothetical protein VMW01_00295 [Williamwhitmania sp.]|nr:hypothetical protein [Williamwhitmania sp.]